MDRGRNYYGRQSQQRKKRSSLTTAGQPFDCSSWNDAAASISQPDHDYFSRHHVRSQSDAFRFRGRGVTPAPSDEAAASACRPKLPGGTESPRNPSFPYKRLLDDNDSSQRKIFASAEKMAEKMSRLRIDNECDQTMDASGPDKSKRLYFNADIDAIQSMSMMLPDLVLQTTKSIDNSRALILWQPPFLQNIYDCNANECSDRSRDPRKPNRSYGFGLRNYSGNNSGNSSGNNDDDDNDDVFIDDSSMAFD